MQKLEQEGNTVEWQDGGDAEQNGLRGTPRSLMGRMLRNGTNMLDRQREWVKVRSRKVQVY